MKKVVMCILIFCMLGNYIYCNASNENLQKTYQVMKSEENDFLQQIYDTKESDLKIKNIEKTESEDNFAIQEKSETKILENKNELYIKEKFGESVEFNDGTYYGELSISNINIEPIYNGYYEKIDEKRIPFNNYKDNDLNNVDKEITIDGVIYYLINVNWEADEIETIDGENIPVTYKGEKIYQTVQQISYPYTYKVTVTYSGQVEKIDTIYEYKISYEENVKVIKDENNKTKPIIIISGVGLVLLMILLNIKNVFVYSKSDKGFRLIKRARICNKNMIIDISKCKNKSKYGIYAIKINKITLKKLKGRTISLVSGNKRKDIILWNDYYEIKF